MTVIEHYNKVKDKLIEIFDSTIQIDDTELLSSNHSFISDFGIWIEILKDRPEYSIFKNAIKEYQMSIICNNLGIYQQAFMGLRFFLERSLIAILFSANLLELNIWKRGERDTYWSEIKDKDTGVFSDKFCRAFFYELKEEIPHFKSMTEKVYRECSEYVHGNLSVIEELPQNIEYSEVLFNKWNEKADTIKRIILFVLCLRYIKTLKPEELRQIESSIKDEFQGISQINELF